MTQVDPFDKIPDVRRRGVDAAAMLTFLVVLLFGIPSQLVFGPLGAAGSPGQLLGLALMLWWVFNRINQNRSAAYRISHTYLAGVALLACVLISYLAATLRPIDGAELRAADRSVLSMVAWLGIMFVAMDGISSRRRLETLLRRICIGGALLALLGIVQFVTKSPIVDVISIPGLTPNQEVAGAAERSGFTRPAGTAIHPLEFGGVLTLILPLALHFGYVDFERRGVRAWLPALAIGAVLMISLSRSAILAAAVVLIVVLPGWSARARRRLYVGLALMISAVYVAVPGMLGTITGLFTGVTDDGSALSRTDSYALAWEFIKQSPLIGRGPGTFLPVYRILDNQYLGSLIEIGVAGTLALVGVFVVSIVTSWRIGSRPGSDKLLARSLMAAVAAGGVSFATFDVFSFPMVPALLFLIIGCASALDRVHRVERAAR